jgi:hypothetical protein
MQTFMPYTNYLDTARILDYRRLGKQRVEAKQILNALDGKSKGWRNHPATKMWRGYEGSLALYGLTMCSVWKERGYQDSLTPFFQERLNREKDNAGTIWLPDWVSNPDLQLSHQSNLIRKDPEYYRPIFGEDVPDDLPYLWVTD